jgi:hypothetical protein
MSTKARMWGLAMVCLTALLSVWLTNNANIIVASINSTRCVVGGL